MIKLTNWYDQEDARQGWCLPDQVRALEVEAGVDTGSMLMLLPAEVVARLGLRVAGYRKARDASGKSADVPWVGGVGVVILGRDTIASALVSPSGSGVRIGRVVLMELDLLVDSVSGELRVTPASPDGPLLESLFAA